MQIITHDGIFHADEVFAVALLQKEFGDVPVIRTRQIEGLSGIFVDIGGIYDATLLKFDHHQQGGAGSRDKGIPYSSLGLVWKTFGRKFCVSDRAFRNLDSKLISYIDGVDNGVTLVKGENIHYLAPVVDLAGVIAKLNSPWDTISEERQGQQFKLAVEFATIILDSFIAQENALEHIDTFILESEIVSEKILVLTQNCPWLDVVLSKMPVIQIVLFPSHNGNWLLQMVPKSKGSFKTKQQFPETWAGKRDSELNAVTGVPDCVFCHNGRHLAGALNKEAALNLAKLALN